jgi:hypothetical protein
MKKLIFLICLTFLSLNAFAQFNPKAGLNFTRQNDQFFEDGKATGEVGWQVGIEARFGEVFYVSPGLYYFSHRSKIEFLNNIGLDDQEVDFNGLRIPVYIGLNVIRTDNFTLRGYFGPNVSLVFNSEDGLRDFFDEDPIEDTLWGLNVGVGVDLGGVSLDISHEWRTNDALDSEQIEFKNNILYFQVGFNIGGRR